MKKYLFVLLILIPYFSQAQNSDAFVEVIVEDTVRLGADEMIFTINFLNADDESNDAVAAIDSSTNQLYEIQPKDHSYDYYKEVLLLIKQFHIDTVKTDELLITPTYGYRPFIRNSIQLKFYSKKNLQQFISKAAHIKNITGYISESTSKKENEGEERLLKKVLSKAKTEANNIAMLSGKKIGKLILVKQMEESSGGWTSYPPLSALGQSSAGMLDTVYPNIANGFVVLRRKIIVRYEWN